MENLKLIVRPNPGKEVELREMCKSIVHLCQSLYGCEGCGFYEDFENRYQMVIEQEWTNKDVLYDFFRSDNFGALLGAVKWLGKSFKLSLNTKTHEQSMNIVLKKRNSSHNIK